MAEQVALVPLVNGHDPPRRLAFGNFAAAVAIDRLEQKRRQVGPALPDFVMHGNRADDAAVAAFPGRLESVWKPSGPAAA